MTTTYEFGQEDFEALLGLFSSDRDEAGEKFMQMKNALVRFFDIKGCADPYSLADETINRVAARIHAFDPSKNARPVSYFYGFAFNILKEYRRASKRETELTDVHLADVNSPETDREIKNGCLDRCLVTLATADMELVSEYYAFDGQKKIAVRKRMCETLNCRSSALHTKVHRIRATLKGCIERCMKSST